MNVRCVWPCAVLLWLVSTGCAPAPLAPSLPQPPGDDPSAWASYPPVQQAIASARAYWTAQQPEYEEDVRVLSVASGSFTRAGAEQRAILYRMSLYPRGFPKKGLLIVEGGRAVRNVAFVLLAEDVEALADFDGDGRDELALEGGFGMGGQYSRGVTIAAFGPQGLRELGHVDSYESVCGADREDAPGPTSARISVAPGSGLMIQHFRQASCATQTWDPLGPAEPLVLEPPQPPDRFEDIPTASP